MNTKTAGKKGATIRWNKERADRPKLIEKLSSLVDHHSTLLKILAEKASNKKLQAIIDELTQHRKHE